MVEIGWVGGSGLSFEEVPVRRRDECWPVENAIANNKSAGWATMMPTEDYNNN